MYLQYGVTGENGPIATQTYAEQLSNYRSPQYKTFVLVHQQLCETESVTSTCHDTGCNRSTRSVPIKEVILHSAEKQPSFCTRGYCSLVWYFALNSVTDTEQ